MHFCLCLKIHTQSDLSLFIVDFLTDSQEKVHECSNFGALIFPSAHSAPLSFAAMVFGIFLIYLLFNIYIALIPDKALVIT